jgi:hypothetical protein
VTPRVFPSCVGDETDLGWFRSKASSRDITPDLEGSAGGTRFLGDRHMLGKLIEGVFGCWHSRYSFPITARCGCRRTEAASLTGTYVVCLDCGKEFPYDWKEMKMISPRWEQRHHLRSLATKEVG